MEMFIKFLPYILLMAGVTYLIRLFPLIFVRGKIENKYVLSFLYYVPYAVLSAMSFPAIMYATGNFLSAFAGLVAALIAAFLEKGLLTTALSASFTALAVELIIMFI